MGYAARVLAWTTAFASVVALVTVSGCGGMDAVEDAPALLGTGIPAAAPGARGVDLPSALVTRSGAGGPTRGKVPPPFPHHGAPADPFGGGGPTPKPVPAPMPAQGGVEL